MPCHIAPGVLHHHCCTHQGTHQQEQKEEASLCNVGDVIGVVRSKLRQIVRCGMAEKKDFES